MLSLALCQAFLSKPIVSKLLTKLTGSDTDPAALAPALLARYDIDGNKVLDKVGTMCLLLCVLLPPH